MHIWLLHTLGYFSTYTTVSLWNHKELNVRSRLCSPSLHLLDQKYSNIEKYHYNFK